MDKISDKYEKVESLYNINAVDNLESIFIHGLLSKNKLKMKRISSVDLSNLSVQSIRSNRKIGNIQLHDYANLYFDARNPMMFYLVNNSNIDDLCVLCIDKKVLDLETTIVTDRNAAASMAFFERPDKGLRYINFDLVFAKFWNDNNCIKQKNNKEIKCAEVLVLDKIPIEYLIKIKAANSKAKQKIDALHLNVETEIDSTMFFK